MICLFVAALGLAARAGLCSAGRVTLRRSSRGSYCDGFPYCRVIAYTLFWGLRRAPKIIDESLRCSTGFVASEGDLTPGLKAGSFTQSFVQYKFY